MDVGRRASNAGSQGRIGSASANAQRDDDAAGVVRRKMPMARSHGSHDAATAGPANQKAVLVVDHAPQHTRSSIARMVASQDVPNIQICRREPLADHRP